MDFEKAAWYTAFFALIAGMIMGIYCLVKVIGSDGRVDYCRILYDNDSSIHLPAYRVIGHRAWRPDIDIAVTISADDAEAKRKALCPN
jgi:hypothetical protein